ncbi:hypothetical protein BH09MYX1_BH09MYX1_34850 [soil metagenome]
METVGTLLKHHRDLRQLTLPEVSRVTRIPLGTLSSIEADRFDDLPGEVFVKGFLKSFAVAVGAIPDEVLARYTSSRRVAIVTPLPVTSPVKAVREGGKRLGIAIAFVVLLILFTLALSIVLKPRGHDIPPELSQTEAPATSVSV